MGNVQRLFEPLAQWQMERVPLRSEGYTLDLEQIHIYYRGSG
jgi:hypothetical protein